MDDPLLEKRPPVLISVNSAAIGITTRNLTTLQLSGENTRPGQGLGDDPIAIPGMHG